MINFHNLQSLLKNDVMTKPPTFQFKEGQIVHGQVLKFFPDNIALVQLGGLKLHAKLHAPLTTNVKYWFQVAANETMIELKLIDDPDLAKMESVPTKDVLSKNQVQQLLKQFGMTHTKENEQLIRMLVKDGLPFTNETLKNASEWLKDTQDTTRAYTAIKVAIQKDYPLTANILNSIYAIQAEEGISSTITNVLADIHNYADKSPSLQQLSNLLKMVSSQNLPDNDMQALYQLVRTALQPKSTTDVEVAHSLLNKVGITAADLSALNSNIVNQNGQIKEDGSHAILKVLQNKNITSEQYAAIKNQLTVIENDLLTKLEQRLPETQLDWTTSKAVFKNIKQLIHTLGTQYEHNLRFIDNQQQLDANIQALKPLLLKALIDESLPSESKGNIEKLLQKITGQQLISVVEQGPIQHLIMQIPIVLDQRMNDLTVHWSGRRKKTGEIDPNFCRIIFYLELAQLKETLVDVHVQNRIINVNIYNETPMLSFLVKSVQPLLKKQLDGLDYHLSSVKVVEKLQETKANTSNQKLSTEQINSLMSNGVDFRV